MRALSLILCLAPLLQPVGAQAPTRSLAAPEVVVTGHITPHCKSLPDDPQDAFMARLSRSHWSRIEPTPDGGYKYVAYHQGGSPNATSLTPLGQWRRAGNALPVYVFRQPTDGTPLCLGKRRPHPLPDDDTTDEVVVTAKAKPPMSGAQLQQLIASGPYLCRSVRLTINLASRGATAMLWLNGGYGQWKSYFVNGTSGWTRVTLEDGPVGFWYPWTGFGVALSGGDVWIDQTRFEIIPDTALNPDQLAAEAACRARLTPQQRAAQGLS